MPGQRGVINSAFHLWFRAFPIQEDDHLLTVLRYIECNPLRAGLVYAAEHWPWSRLPACIDPKATGAYIMWSGSPWAHLHIKIGPHWMIMWPFDGKTSGLRTKR
jgi:hypothetical protein